uniref:Uncharacterized protein n=1 Tax=Arundo donax TaxID=35708 RepID=A0A0A9F7N7_ARUDO
MESLPNGNFNSVYTHTLRPSLLIQPAREGAPVSTSTTRKAFYMFKIRM